MEHLKNKNSGEGAVDEAISLVADISKDAGLADISVFLKRIAKAESEYGANKNTYRPGYYGGIWQVDEIAYDATKDLKSHPKLKTLHDSIKKISLSGGAPIDWSKTKWDDLTIPAYSCVAARAKLATIPDPVPTSLKEQAVYWKKHYNTEAGAGTEAHFVKVNSE